MASPKPDQILWLEKEIGVPLHSLRSDGILDPKNRTCFEMDVHGHVVGLNLSFCQITNTSFLVVFPNLTSLDVSGNIPTDWSFLKGLNQLTSLNLSLNSITDWSFLKGMSGLTSLNLSGNNLTDWSFLKGMSGLTSLNLSGNNITDGSFLSELSQLNFLYLSGNNITKGSFLSGLSQLTLLDLSQNNITEGSFLRGLSQLTSLDVSGNNITDGSFLREMSQLTSLDVSGNNITGWSFLKLLSRLTSLDVSWNNITDWSFLKKFLKKMSRLTLLDVSGNNITDGSFLKQLRRLTLLYLSMNKLTDGSFLKEMSQLTSLDVSGNKITDWSFLKEMSRLTSLNLSQSSISDGSLQSSISDGSFLKGMTQLASLDLSQNKLKEGSFLRGMSQLTSLNLSGNNIKEGSFLRGMSQLISLDLSQNELEKLPPELYELDLEIRIDDYIALPYSINVVSNPHKEPPREIVELGHAAIIDWYRSSLEGEIDINEVKVILVGDGSAGKTTVRKRLMRLKGDPNESQTHGIDIKDHEIQFQGRNILAHFWDFGGQEIMHATHQFFLSRRSLYILVLDGRKEEDADYWLKHIESFGGDSPILVCLNKIDQNPSFEVDRKNLKEKYPGIVDFYRLKCLDDGDKEVKRLIEELPQNIARVEMSKSKWPRKWANVKVQLQNDDKPYIDQNEFARICVDKLIKEESQQHTLIRFLNDLGIALHFDDRRLRLVQILNPRWATQAVYRIINDSDTANTLGFLDLKRLPTILKPTDDEHFEYPAEKLEYIIDLMKKFELCHELPEDRILLPDLLGVQEPEFQFSKKDILRFRFQYEYLPTSILPRIIVQMHTDTDDNLRWRTGVVLRRNDGRARVVIRTDRHARRITIESEGIARREYFAVIRDRFDKIHKEFQKFRVTELVPLPDHPEIVVKYSDLQFHEEKRRETILVGEVQQEYDVQTLLNGIESPERRKARRDTEKSINNYFFNQLIQGDIVGETFNTNIGDGTSGTIITGKNINHVTAEKIENSFNKASNATDRPEDIRKLLQSLAQEIAKIVEKLPPEKAEEAATDLETITEESIKEKPAKKYWELSKKGIIEAAEAVGAIGTTAISLVTKLGPLLGF